MNRALLNMPVLVTGFFSLAATVMLSVLVFSSPSNQPTNQPSNAPEGGLSTQMLDEPMAAPKFEVTTHRGELMTRQSMLGKVWVCDFFLTRCNGICPMLSRQMADLADKLAQDKALAGVELVSFSVDPAHDTVDRLALYRQKHMPYWSRDRAAWRDAIEQRWSHTRASDEQAFWALVRDGFKLTVGPSVNDPSTPVAHSGKFVLIDQHGQICGYYDGMTQAEMPALLADIRRLLAE